MDRCAYAGQALQRAKTAAIIISFNIRAPNVFGVDNAVLLVWRDSCIVYHAGCLMDRSGKCDDEDSFEKEVERESA